MNKILEIKRLKVLIHKSGNEFQIIRNISLDLYEGEILAIVGESGSGKSILSKSVTKLLPNDVKISSGEIIFNDLNIVSQNEKKIQKIRGKDIAMIFQDPMLVLNPLMSIGKQIAEPLIKHTKVSKKKAMIKVIELLDLVGLFQAKNRLKNYPHQFSGGERQRISIAISLICNPKILIADEPTTALDEKTKMRILNLLKSIAKKIRFSIIFITHDLSIIENLANRVAVMYAGKIVEIGATEEIFYNPKHPYTWQLLESLPNQSLKSKYLYSIPGIPPNLEKCPKGDLFRYRNEFALKIDVEKHPPFFEVSATHKAATWLLASQAPKIVPPLGIQKRWLKFLREYSQS